MPGTFVTSVNADGPQHTAATINKPQVHHHGASKPSLGDLSVNWDNVTNRQQRIMQGLQKWNDAETSEFLEDGVEGRKDERRGAVVIPSLYFTTSHHLQLKSAHSG